MTDFGKHVRVTLTNGLVVEGIFLDYCSLHLCIGDKWVNLNAIKKIVAT